MLEESKELLRLREEARVTLRQARQHEREAGARHESVRLLFEQRQCGLEEYLSAVRDAMLANAEVRVAELRLAWLSPPKADGNAAGE